MHTTWWCFTVGLFVSCLTLPSIDLSALFLMCGYISASLSISLSLFIFFSLILFKRGKKKVSRQAKSLRGESRSMVSGIWCPKVSVCGVKMEGLAVAPRNRGLLLPHAGNFLLKVRIQLGLRLQALRLWFWALGLKYELPGQVVDLRDGIYMFFSFVSIKSDRDKQIHAFGPWDWDLDFAAQIWVS